MLKYLPIILILTITLIITGHAFAQEDVEYWEPPTECADEDREIPGNRQSSCKYVMPELIRLEYQVDMEYPLCVEKLIAYLPGIKPFPREWEQHKFDKLGLQYTTHHQFNRAGNIPYESYDMQSAFNGRVLVSNGLIIFNGIGLREDSPVGQHSPSFDFDGSDTAQAKMYIQRGWVAGQNWYTASNYVRYPDMSRFNSMVNTCLLLVKQERENIEHAAALARQRAEETARLAAEADAITKEEAQALLDAETQALIAKQQLEAARASKANIARIEALRTETLVTQLAHQEILAGIVQEIVRIRLSGQEDRARITNEYLVRIRANNQEFDEDTADIEARIQEYLDFNDELLVAISEYQTALRVRIEGLEASLQEQLDEIKDIEGDAEEIATPPTATPEPES